MHIHVSEDCEDILKRHRLDGFFVAYNYRIQQSSTKRMLIPKFLDILTGRVSFVLSLRKKFLQIWPLMAVGFGITAPSQSVIMQAKINDSPYMNHNYYLFFAISALVRVADPEIPDLG